MLPVCIIIMRETIDFLRKSAEELRELAASAPDISDQLRRLAEDAKLDPDFAEKFLNFIVKEVIRHHEAIAKARG